MVYNYQNIKRMINASVYTTTHENVVDSRDDSVNCDSNFEFNL